MARLPLLAIVLVLASCGGATGRPTLPPPDYEEPGAPGEAGDGSAGALGESPAAPASPRGDAGLADGA